MASMELNLTTVINNNQENQLLLNAIKNKFATKTDTEAVVFSPPKFNIPVLKIPGDKNKSGQNSEGSESTQLNTFLLKRLQERHKTNGLNKPQAGLVLPTLQLGNRLLNNEQTKVNFELPALKTTNTSITCLTTALNKLQVDEHSKGINNPTKSQISTTPAIDLTSALASKLQNQQVTPPTRVFKKTSKNLQNNDDLNFKIPFIDCDRIDVTRICTNLLPTSNEYCVADVSQLRLKHNLVEPSAIGRLLNSHDNKYTEPLPLKCFSAEFQHKNAKHTIEPFLFDTKSPDDLVIEALIKYQRRYHN